MKSPNDINKILMKLLSIWASLKTIIIMVGVLVVHFAGSYKLNRVISVGRVSGTLYRALMKQYY